MDISDEDFVWIKENTYDKDGYSTRIRQETISETGYWNGSNLETLLASLNVARSHKVKGCESNCAWLDSLSQSSISLWLNKF